MANPPWFFVFQDYCYPSWRAWRSVQPPHLRLEGCSWSDALPLRQQECAGHTTAQLRDTPPSTSPDVRPWDPSVACTSYISREGTRRVREPLLITDTKVRGGGFRAQRYEEQQFEDQARLAFRSPTPPSPPVHPTSPAAQGTDLCRLGDSSLIRPPSDHVWSLKRPTRPALASYTAFDGH
uniref:Uncharacterized protein n=1 Tax=Branchiostoma floridae TaxID=7739 RepID=C3YKA2_BRAFL|eukprot:XP_002603252.1 hypothetical protein BRAFLDRAFT_93317 [Branchiostoma floridae]